MIRYFRLTFIALLALASLGACATISPGHIGLKVDLYGAEKGVGPEELPPGRYFNGISHQFYEFPTFTQNVTWESKSENRGEIVFQTREGLTTTVNMGLKYHLDSERISDIFQTYRKGVDEITEVDVKNIVRNAMNRVASGYFIRDIYGAKKTEFLDAVFVEVVEKTGLNGIIVEELFVVGTFFLPDEVYASINSTQKAEQDALMRTNEIESTKAEAQKAIEEARGAAESIRLRAEAEATANRVIAESISPVLIDYYRVQAWDGVMPRVTGSEGLIIDLSPDDQ